MPTDDDAPGDMPGMLVKRTPPTKNSPQPVRPSPPSYPPENPVPPSSPPELRAPTATREPTSAGSVTAALLGQADAVLRARLEPLVPDSAVDIAALRRAVHAHVAEGERRQADNEFLDLAMCRKLARVSTGLLDLMPLLDGDMQAAIVVAVRYFCQTDDEEDDFASAIGFDDDADVMRQLLTLLGRMDLWTDT